MTGFHHRVPLERIRPRRDTVRLEAGPQARAEVAERFDLVAIDRLEAELELWRTARGAEVEGRIVAEAVQRCVVSGEPVPVRLEEPLHLHFRSIEGEGDELELEPEDLDVMPIEAGSIDLGEAIVQTMVLALPEYPRLEDARVPGLLSEAEAESIRARDNPFAVLRRP